MARCRQELCQNWSGDGNVCPCAMLDLDPPSDDVCEDCGSMKFGDVCDDCGSM